jgi:glycosyltransferase involved in cell wall biosynthesis
MPKITVIIPTCDRVETLEHCLKTVTNQDFDSLEILISNNSSTDETEDFLRNQEDSRIKIIKSPKRLGMSEHWDFALTHASGEWVTFLGDDDGLLPRSLSLFCELVEREKIEAVSSICCSFNWPLELGDEGRLSVPTGEGYDILNAKMNLELAMQDSFSYSHLPWIYTGGFAKTKLLKKLAKVKGRFFLSITPDLYSSVALSSNIDNYAFSKTPFFIGGTSKKSNGLQTFNSSPDKIESIPFFSENKTEFYKGLGNGFVPSLSFLLYECYMQSNPVRDFDLDIRLEDQIIIALVKCKKRNFSHVVEYMKKVCLENSINWSHINKSYRSKRSINQIYKKIRKIFSVFDTKRTDYKRYNSSGLQNVFDASLKAEAILSL